jgi:hypothetical protein
MKLKFLSDETLMDLRNNFHAYKEHYFNKNHQWFDQYFNGEGRAIEAKIDFEMPMFNVDEDNAVSDRENVKILYEALKHLTVSHIQFRDFVFFRLKKELEEKNENRLNSALFFKHGNKRSLFVHVLARLWWVGYMTYDEENPTNPYWLTDFFTEKDFSARSVIFFSSNFTSNRNITKGILKSLIKLRDRGIIIKRDHFVQANKYLNVVGGAMILDMLSTNEVEEMVDNYLSRYYGYKIEADYIGVSK